MLPILLQCFTPGKAIFIAPLFFGVGKFLTLNSAIPDCFMNPLRTKKYNSFS